MASNNIQMSTQLFKINEKFTATTDRAADDDAEEHATSLWLVSPHETGTVRATWEVSPKKRTAPIFFMKSWSKDGTAEYGSVMQELEILRMANRTGQSNIVIELVASSVSLKNIHIIMELASEGTMRSRYFPNGTLVLDNSATIGSDQHVKFLRECCAPFFKNILSFLHTIVGRVYCDWKFDNILCCSNNDTKSAWPRLKLTDFGAAQQIGKAIVNPKKFNQAYTPITLCSELDMIVPRIEDDYDSVRFLFIKLNGQTLSWESVAETFPSPPKITSLHYLVIALLKSDLFVFDPSKCIYWPDFLNIQ